MITGDILYVKERVRRTEEGYEVKEITEYEAWNDYETFLCPSCGKEVGSPDDGEDND